MSDVTLLQQSLEKNSDPQVAAHLLPLVYDELRALAGRKLSHEKQGQTLEATALVHEAYLRLVAPGEIPNWQGRRHFVAAAAEAMRRILIDRARRKRSVKHGGDRQRIDLVDVPFSENKFDLLALDEALERLATQDSSKAEVVKLRFFLGLTMPEVALALNISLATAERHWNFARAWLFSVLGDAAENHAIS